MTAEERSQYNRLSRDAKMEYDYTQKKHPNWSHNQIMTKVGVVGQIDIMVEGGEDVNPTDPSTLVIILNGAKKYLVSMGIMIKSVFTIIDNAVSSLRKCIDLGLDYIGNKVIKALDWLFE